MLEYKDLKVIMENKSKNVHDGHRKRLREKFIAGKESFKEHELLEMLLGYAIPRKNTNPLAHALLDKFGSLQNVLKADVNLLTTVEGIGESAALFLTLVGYANTFSLKQEKTKKQLSNIEQTKEVLIELFKDLDHEVFYVLYLNDKNKVISMTKLDDNSKNSVNIDFKEITKGILINKPSSIIIAHNHFAKYPAPSKEDDRVTKKLCELLQFYQVNFYDHLIISGNEVYSYFYDNRLQKIKNDILNI